MKKHTFQDALKIVVLVLLAGGLWSVVADRLPYPAASGRTIKPWSFLLVGALAASIAVRQQMRASRGTGGSQRKGDEQYRALFEKSTDLILLLTPQGAIAYSSPSAQQLLGYAPADLVGRDALSFVHPEDGPRLTSAFEDLQRSGNKVMVVSYRACRADGSWLHLEAIVNNLLDHPEINGIVVTARDITAQQALEAALREQIHFLQHLMDSIPLPIFYKDAEGRYRGCNRSFEHFFGKPKSEIIGKSVFEIAPAELAQTYARRDDELFQNPGVQTYEHAVRHADGSLHHVEFYKSTFTDVNGRVAGLIGAMLDTTDRRGMDKSLRETNALLGALVRASPLAIVVFGREGEVLLWNPAAERIFGWSERDVVGDFNPLVQEDSKQEFLDLLQRVLAGETLVNLDLRRGRKDGAIIDVRVSSAPVLDAEGEAMGIISVIADVTEQKRSEEDREKLIDDIREALHAVGQSKKEWQDTFDSITDLISIHDKEFRIIKANKAFSANLGLRPTDIINRKCYELLHHGAVTPIAGCPHARTLRERTPASEEVYDNRSKKTFNVTTYPYFSPGGEIIGTIHIARDITEDKQREMRMIMRERLVSLGQMASGIAHEINNPLESLMICAELLLTRVATDRYDHALFEKYLKVIDEEVLRCRDITRNMLSFARQTSSEMKRVDLHEALQKTIELIGYQGRLKHVQLSVQYHPQGVSVLGNESELRQVFLAILVNALDAMKNRGALSIDTRVNDGMASVAIRDDGPGIEPEDVQKIFLPFFTTKGGKGGTGLGLSIAQQIIVNHNGVIAVESTPGRGAVFTIKLPS